MDYISPPLVTEPSDLANEAFAYLEAQAPGWLPSPGNLETWVIESQAALAGELMDVASAVPTSIFRYFGESILLLPALEGASATGYTTWTVADDLGYTIPAGTLVGVPTAGDTLLPFAVAQDTVIPTGSTTAGAVVIVAQDAGTEGNGLTGVADLVDALTFVVSVTLDAPTSGGVDAETDEEYLSRLRQLAQLLAPRPILPNDFAVMAMQVAGVERATAIDLYNLETGETGVPRCVTVIVADADGNPLSPEKKAEVDALLQAQREVNFLVFVGDPTYLAIDVNFTVKLFPTVAPDAVAAVVDAAAQAVTEYLSPATFGQAPYGDQAQWLLDDHVRYLEVAEVINRVDGVWYIGTLTVNGGTADVPLPAHGGLPTPGAITGAAL